MSDGFRRRRIGAPEPERTVDEMNEINARLQNVLRRPPVPAAEDRAAPAGAPIDDVGPPRPPDRPGLLRGDNPPVRPIDEAPPLGPRQVRRERGEFRNLAREMRENPNRVAEHAEEMGLRGEGRGMGMPPLRLGLQGRPARRALFAADAMPPPRPAAAAGQDGMPPQAPQAPQEEAPEEDAEDVVEDAI